MENTTNERVLAYALAKGLDYEEMEKVSGGSKGTTHITTGPTVKATGGSGQGVEVVIDVTADLDL